MAVPALDIRANTAAADKQLRDQQQYRIVAIVFGYLRLVRHLAHSNVQAKASTKRAVNRETTIFLIAHLSPNSFYL